MSDEKLKIGFVGVGAMGQCAHLRNYVTIPDCEVVAIAELREDIRELIAYEPYCADCGTKEDLIVRIGSANFRRYQAGLQILPEKCTVICENCLLKRQK